MKTKPTEAGVETFLDAIADENRRRDCYAVLKMMKAVTGTTPRMWGPSIVGFGSYHYTYESGREGDWFLAGFSPRKQDLTIYVTAGLHHYGPQLRRLGKHKMGKSCLYIKRLEDVDGTVLREILGDSVRRMKTSAR